MRMIAAVSQDWGIGCNGELLYNLPGEKKRFRTLTMGHSVVMGRATWASLPGPAPLPGRQNYVLTRDYTFQLEGIAVLHSLGELAQVEEDAWVIGGASLYESLISCCTEAELTFVEAVRPADRFFPDLTRRREWVLISESAPIREGGLTYTFRRYRNLAPQPLPEQ
ncbi:MAG: dihydrofolate reductase [Clostridiales bacterium]|nr:dihydrofolate reductase [Clostridiales bacterium]